MCWEYYFAILLEREFNGPVIVGSPMGGMDIEEVAENHPEALKMIGVDIKEGLTDDKAREMAIFMGFQGNKASLHSFIFEIFPLERLLLQKKVRPEMFNFLSLTV